MSNNINPLPQARVNMNIPVGNKVNKADAETGSAGEPTKMSDSFEVAQANKGSVRVPDASKLTSSYLKLLTNNQGQAMSGKDMKATTNLLKEVQNLDNNNSWQLVSQPNSWTETSTYQYKDGANTYTKTSSGVSTSYTKSNRVAGKEANLSIGYSRSTVNGQTPRTLSVSASVSHGTGEPFNIYQNQAK
jgi:hypothetical protein